MKIVIGSVISRYPCVAGSVWNRLHFAVGLRRLGHEVFFVEELAPEACVDVDGERAPFEGSANRQLFGRLVAGFGFDGRACQIYDGGAATAGLTLDALRAHLPGALLVNMSGHVRHEAVLGSVARRAYVDQDPVYTQLWRAEYGEDLGFGAHDVFFSVGLNIGTPSSPIPDAGVVWHPLLPVVVPDLWPAEDDSADARFTTVASWAGGYGDLQYQGTWYGAKHEAFEALADLPQQTGQGFEAALKSYPDDDPGIERMRAGGWHITSARRLDTLERYRRFVGASRAEIGVAKTAYVKGRSGWFSDRAAHYLASGRPVLAEATGFEGHLPTGEGLLTFRTPDEAAEGVRAINADYPAHARAARRVAREHLDYRAVLPEMLDRCGL